MSPLFYGIKSHNLFLGEWTGEGKKTTGGTTKSSQFSHPLWGPKIRTPFLTPVSKKNTHPSNCANKCLSVHQRVSNPGNIPKFT